ncbi:MAG: putative exported protein [Betaproteobacteria bacterium]|nr:putative exported protein [Betaproteobacteria bacterium]
MRKCLALAFILGGITAAMAADNYPTKPVRLVVPFAPGGGNDIAARFVAQRLTEAFGESAVVDNRAGAGSTIGTDIVAKSAPDGYTLLVVHNAIAINQTLYAKLPYDTVRDFAQVAMIGTTTNTLVINPGVSARSVKELITLLKNKPGSLNYASTGAGGTAHLAMEYFRLETGTNLVHIPYKGTAPGLTDVVGNQVQVMISALPGTVPFINAKRVIALATTGSKRSAFLPELPTLNEAGVTGYEFDTFYGLHAPAKVSKDIITRLNAEIVKALTKADVKDQLFKQGIEAQTSSPAEFTKYVRNEVAKMGKIIKASGAKAEQ